MEVRPPFFLHGNKRNGTWARALPNARIVAGVTRPEPFSQAMALILGPEFPIWVQVFIAQSLPRRYPLLPFGAPMPCAAGASTFEDDTKKTRTMPAGHGGAEGQKITVLSNFRVDIGRLTSK